MALEPCLFFSRQLCRQLVGTAARDRCCHASCPLLNSGGIPPARIRAPPPPARVGDLDLPHYRPHHCPSPMPPRSRDRKSATNSATFAGSAGAAAGGPDPTPAAPSA